MNSLSTYYYYTAVIFLISMICDIVFYSNFSTCPLGNSAAGLFLGFIILNSMIAALMLKLGFLVNFFHQMDPDEMITMGLFKKIAGILVKVCPTVCKLLHYIKLILVIICSYFAFISNTPNVDYITDVNFNTSTLTNQNCKNKTSTIVVNLLKNYKNQVVIFEAIEISSVFIVLCILGSIKNLLDIEGHFYEPYDPRNGKCRKFFCRRLGP